MTEEQKQRITAWVAFLLGWLAVYYLCGCSAGKEAVRGEFCGVQCIFYDHSSDFAANLGRFPVDVDTLGGAFRVFLPGEPYPADWVVDSTLAWGPLVIDTHLIETIELLEPVHTRRIEGLFGDHGLFWIRTHRDRGQEDSHTENATR